MRRVNFSSYFLVHIRRDREWWWRIFSSQLIFAALLVPIKFYVQLARTGTYIFIFTFLITSLWDSEIMRRLFEHSLQARERVTTIPCQP